MTTLPRRTRRRISVPAIASIEQWETNRQTEQANYRQAAKANQAGTFRIRPSIKELVALATFGLAPVAIIIAIAIASIDTILVVGSIISAGSGTWLLVKRPIRSATEVRQHESAESTDEVRR